MAKRNSLTHRRLVELLDYDAKSGLFLWKIDGKNGIKAGEKAGTIAHHNYVKITIGQKRYYAHRLAWFYVRKRWPKLAIDHMNGLGGDNRYANLREAGQDMNMQNLRVARADNRCGVLGVTKRPSGRYAAQIVFGGQYRYLGLFETPEGAGDAYLEAKRELHPGCTL